MRLSNIVFGAVVAMQQIYAAGALPTRFAGRNAPSSKMPLERRSLDVDSLNCMPEWFDIHQSMAYNSWIQEGIDYLRKIPTGKPALGPGPGNCERVSCEWESAIYWCNEGSETKELDSFGTIADAAEYIQQSPACRHDEGYWIMGQVYMKDQWSVKIQTDKC
ncbi:hypothetical protein N0V85_005846 [Neurospora sp. IMI 360204]|nr:hypothetical protein N0V85_005846 [Neurospora sp. IMI 360204]